MITGRELDRGMAIATELTGIVMNTVDPTQAAAEISQGGAPFATILFKQADLAKVEDCAAVFQFAKTAMGYVDCLVNCAAICAPR